MYQEKVKINQIEAGKGPYLKTKHQNWFQIYLSNAKLTHCLISEKFDKRVARSINSMNYFSLNLAYFTFQRLG